MTEQTKTVRDELKELSSDEFQKRTRAQMEEGAKELGIEDTSAHKTKGDLYDAMVEAADLPDPSLRGESTVEEPVARVWRIADEMHTAARKAGEKAPRRKDCVNAAIEAGVAFYTARTQYQAWYKHTVGGEKLMSDGNLDGAPKQFQPAPVVEEEKAEA